LFSLKTTTKEKSNEERDRLGRGRETATLRVGKRGGGVTTTEKKRTIRNHERKQGGTIQAETSGVRRKEKELKCLRRGNVKILTR